MDSNFIYLDYNATTPVDERVMEAMIPYFNTRYANPNSTHLFGLSVRDAVEEATENLAAVLGAGANNILYTSGATEAINLAIKGLLPSGRKHIVTVATEHKAVLDCCSFIEKMGYQITRLPVNSEGMIDLELLQDCITEDTLLVSVMTANSETGVIHPIKKISNIVHQKGAWMLSDATQAVGKIPVDVKDMEVDLLAFSAHKFYGPKGIGGLYFSNAAKRALTPQIHGGGQQAGLRSGTLNTPGIIGMSKAATIAAAEIATGTERIINLRNKLEKELLTIAGTFRNGHTEQRLGNTANIGFKGVSAEQLIMGLGRISVSNGSACSSAITKPSHVLKAMGLSDADGLSSLRFSLGRFTTAEEIETTVEKTKAVVARLRTNG
ncbi:MAG: cysteine desulfurase [Chitinophagaceae bacterium]|jgi:cysteine desulfurase|nr:cysteine desulfurase [Chitinophagaceae bacterium]